MASRAIATLSLHLLAVGVVGRRAQEENGFPTSALKAVGTLMGAGGPLADLSAAQPKVAPLNHHVPGQMHAEGPSSSWDMNADQLDLAHKRYQAMHPQQQASKPAAGETASFKGHAFASYVKASPRKHNVGEEVKEYNTGAIKPRTKNIGASYYPGKMAKGVPFASYLKAKNSGSEVRANVQSKPNSAARPQAVPVVRQPTSPQTSAERPWSTPSWSKPAGGRGGGAGLPSYAPWSNKKK